MLLLKAKERIRELEKELESLQQKLNEQEDKSNKMYLHMYKKDCEAGPSTSRVSCWYWFMNEGKFQCKLFAGFDGTTSRSFNIVQLQRFGVDASTAGHKRWTRQFACKWRGRPQTLLLIFAKNTSISGCDAFFTLLWRFLSLRAHSKRFQTAIEKPEMRKDLSGALWNAL